MQNHQHNFIDFLLKHKALKFGEFTLKSGRISPYFFNLGTFNTGEALAKLGEFYATTLLQSNISCDVLYGPAYKGIPLVAATSIALHNKYKKNTPYCFNRKEAKDHGLGGILVGSPMEGDVVMVDDVITAGTTVRETIALVKKLNANLAGIIIAFDRQERGLGEQSAVQETAKEYGVPVQSIITLQDLIGYMDEHEEMQDQLKNIQQYQVEYGV